MAERDPQFEQDVLRIVYGALTDREALAAVLSEQQPMPVAPGAALSPLEVGVQGGASVPIPPTYSLRLCANLVHYDYEDLGFDSTTESNLHDIEVATGATREQILQEAMRRVLADKVTDLKGMI